MLFDNWDDISALMSTATGLAIPVQSAHAMEVNNAAIVQKKN